MNFYADGNYLIVRRKVREERLKVRVTLNRIMDVVNYWTIFNVKKMKYMIIIKEKTAPLMQPQIWAQVDPYLL